MTTQITTKTEDTLEGLNKIKLNQVPEIDDPNYLPCEPEMLPLIEKDSLKLTEVYFDSDLDAVLPMRTLLNINEKCCFIIINKEGVSQSNGMDFLLGRVSSKIEIDSYGKTNLEIGNISGAKLGENTLCADATKTKKVRGVARAIPVFNVLIWGALLAILAFNPTSISRTADVVTLCVGLSVVSLIALASAPACLPRTKRTFGFRLPYILPPETRELIRKNIHKYSAVYVLCDSEGLWYEEAGGEAKATASKPCNASIVGMLKKTDRYGVIFGSCTLLPTTN